MSERPGNDDVLGSATPEPGAERDPQEWVTGEEPMTGPQRSYLDNLARQAGEEIPADLTKAEASEHIERLQAKQDGQQQGQQQPQEQSGQDTLGG